MKVNLLLKIYVVVALSLMALITLIVPLSAPAYAQEQLSLRDRADELYSKYEYANAAILYEQLANTKKPRLEYLERLADSYAKMKDYSSAALWYARVVQHADSSPEHLLRYGEVLKSQGKYTEAREQFEEYAVKTGDGKRVSVLLAGCDSALVWMSSPTPHVLRNEQDVNTPLSEFSVFPYGDKVYYTGEPGEGGMGREYGWTGNAFLRIYTADRSDGNGLTHAAVAGEHLNNELYHVGPVAIDRESNALYVTRTYPGQNLDRTRENSKRFHTHKLELYIHTFEEDRWVLTPFAYNNVQAYSLGHAALSLDGSILYFVSDMPGGYGGTDIWYSEKQDDGGWGVPQNAGAVINSAGNELFPTVGPENTLYYSSDGFAGMGGLDIFRSVGSEDSWSVPENLKYPVNSPGDDFAYVEFRDSDLEITGYLSSNRSGGVGGDDIYSFSLEKPRIVIILMGVAMDKSTGEGLPSTSLVLHGGEGEVVAHTSSAIDGTFGFVLDVDKTYRVLASKEGYHSDSAEVSTVGIIKSDTLKVTLMLEPEFKVGDTFELENIYYDFDKHNIRADAALVLDELAETLKKYPTLRIELSSHTDCRGSHAYNERLSQRRAQSAVDYLVSRGISSDRMVAQGYGERRLVNHCRDGVSCSRADHQANRRTEVTVLGL